MQAEEVVVLEVALEAVLWVGVALEALGADLVVVLLVEEEPLEGGNHTKKLAISILF
jgi:hypothetical protein